MQALRSILERWPDGWRYPELLVTLVRPGGGMDVAALAKGVVEGIASPMRPEETFSLMILKGEFEVASTVMQTMGFRSAIASDLYASLPQALEDARRQTLNDMHGRLASLEARASRIGMQREYRTEIDQALDMRAADAEALLELMEEELVAEETKVSNEIKRRLGEVLGTIQGMAGPDITAWKTAVERCIEAREFEAARFLLRRQPSATDLDEPAVVPRLPTWPWTIPLAEALQWFQGTQPAPPEFHVKWRHALDDRAATRLLEQLQMFSHGGAADGRIALEFTASLDALLGHEVPDGELVERDGWFGTRLHAPVDPRLPCLGASGRAGVRLWIPRSLSPVTFAEANGGQTALFFLPNAAILSPSADVGIGPWTLFSLLADKKHRHVNFLREVGRRIDLKHVIPADLGGITLPSGDPSSVRVFTRWLIDIINIDLADPALIDVILYYSGAQKPFVLHLMRALLSSISSRRSPISENDIRRIWNSPDFREATRREILRPLDPEPLVRAVLGAALFEGSQPASLLTPDDLSFVLQEFWDAKISATEVQSSLDRLAQFGLIDVLEDGMRYQLPASGITSIISDTVNNVDQDVRRALELAGRIEAAAPRIL